MPTKKQLKRRRDVNGQSQPTAGDAETWPKRARWALETNWLGGHVSATNGVAESGGEPKGEVNTGEVLCKAGKLVYFRNHEITTDDINRILNHIPNRTYHYKDARRILTHLQYRLQNEILTDYVYELALRLNDEAAAEDPPVFLQQLPRDGRKQRILALWRGKELAVATRMWHPLTDVIDFNIIFDRDEEWERSEEDYEKLKKLRMMLATKFVWAMQHTLEKRVFVTSEAAKTKLFKGWRGLHLNDNFKRSLVPLKDIPVLALFDKEIPSSGNDAILHDGDSVHDSEIKSNEELSADEDMN